MKMLSDYSLAELHNELHRRGSDEKTLIELIEEIREFCRMHGDWTVTVNLHGLYCCYWVKAIQLTEVKICNVGKTLKKQLQKTLDFLEAENA